MTQGLEGRRWRLGGQVQGVGFRPFVYRLAHQFGLKGFIQNCSGTVIVIAEGSHENLADFSQSLVQQAPPLSRPTVLSEECCTPEGFATFEIRPSHPDLPEVHVPADTGCCTECLADLRTPGNRRHGYALTNCSQCGPRYTVIAKLPYDRVHTSMADFQLCPDCAREYGDPADRRFHAEPLACPRCGPQLDYLNIDSGETSAGEAALERALEDLRAGRIVAVKNVGGYHLACDALNSEAIERLRHRKQRPEKPLAVLYRDSDCQPHAHPDVLLDALTSKALLEPDRPIILAPKREGGRLPENIAPGLAEVGILCPSSPLQYLLIEAFEGPLVMTSGNVSGEPVITDNQEAEKRLRNIADSFLHHNRPILRPADDSVMRPVAGRLQSLRLGRGQAPLEITLPRPLPEPLLAVGGHTKNSIALGWNQRVIISPHIGDLESPRSARIFDQVIRDLQNLYQVSPARITHDAHPDYASTRWARRSELPSTPVYHHAAHASALAILNPSDRPWLVFTWDGVGLGPDGTLWGGEALLGTPDQWKRVASLHPFRLAGGEQVARAPWRSAASLCWEAGESYPAPPLLRQAWEKGLNSPLSSAAGRLFDGASALLGLCREASYEGQAPMMLEAAAENASFMELPMTTDSEGIIRSDWRPLIPMLLDDQQPLGWRAGCFHASLAIAIVNQAKCVRNDHGPVHIGLTGGVFQNRRLSELALTALEAAGFSVALSHQVPGNDAGLCLGQLIEGACQDAG